MYIEPTDRRLTVSARPQPSQNVSTDPRTRDTHLPRSLNYVLTGVLIFLRLIYFANGLTLLIFSIQLHGVYDTITDNPVQVAVAAASWAMFASVVHIMSLASPLIRTHLHLGGELPTWLDLISVVAFVTAISIWVCSQEVEVDNTGPVTLQMVYDRDPWTVAAPAMEGVGIAWPVPFLVAGCVRACAK
jgi:hypothetical protein